MHINNLDNLITFTKIRRFTTYIICNTSDLSNFYRCLDHMTCIMKEIPEILRIPHEPNDENWIFVDDFVPEGHIWFVQDTGAVIEYDIEKANHEDTSTAPN